MTKTLSTLQTSPPAKIRGKDAPTPRAAMALAKSKAYQDAADAPATLKAYATDWANFNAWCSKHGFTPMPATPEVIGAYLAAAGEGYALPTLRRRVAAIARACGIAGHPLDTKHPPSVKLCAASVASTGHHHVAQPLSPSPTCASWSEPAVLRLRELATVPSSSSASQVPCAVRNWSA